MTVNVKNGRGEFSVGSNGRWGNKIIIIIFIRREDSHKTNQIIRNVMVRYCIVRWGNVWG